MVDKRQQEKLKLEAMRLSKLPILGKLFGKKSEASVSSASESAPVAPISPVAPTPEATAAPTTPATPPKAA